MVCAKGRFSDKVGSGAWFKQVRGQMTGSTSELDDVTLDQVRLLGFARLRAGDFFPVKRQVYPHDRRDDGERGGSVQEHAARSWSPGCAPRSASQGPFHARSEPVILCSDPVDPAVGKASSIQLEGEQSRARWRAGKSVLARFTGLRDEHRRLTGESGHGADGWLCQCAKAGGWRSIGQVIPLESPTGVREHRGGNHHCPN
jgi:hypothetical protein